MQRDIELFADTVLMLMMTVVASLLLRADPMLPPTWLAATFLMTKHRR